MPRYRITQWIEVDLDIDAPSLDAAYGVASAHFLETELPGDAVYGVWKAEDNLMEQERISGPEE